MSALNTQPNVARPDDLYELLIEMHQGLSEPESWRLNARLILLLMNQIGDEQVLRQAIAAARGRG
ncbi:DUF2783 domain-containing protein [Steroidobacter sp.]|uniref:DUF2783 domain-containing protein n=1 Tax=Steroidobacter sp. TaxID=1978227 RepID=UPI001A5768B3|nr:DUF2783 domain-containing protein [Steroidobacter sp.]MBL8271789.1 DUF2783 domain-containing protein [Steroidobacter sp.]